MMAMRWVAGVLLAAVASLNSAWANDGYGELGLGGVVQLGRTSAVRMEKEVLEVNPGKIRVDYVFVRNVLNDTTPISVLFPLPLYGAESPSWTWVGAPEGFSVKIDGKHAPFKSLVRARKGRCADYSMSRTCGEDVTVALKKLGLSDEQIAHYPSATPFFTAQGAKPRVPPLSEKQAKLLVREGLADEEGPTGQRIYPDWLADVTYLWEMNFEGKKQLQVSHEYVPFTSGGTNSYFFSEDVLRNEYCADDRFIAAWKRIVETIPESSGEGVPLKEGVMGSRVEYILTTANTWDGPIRDFTLRLKKSAPDELVSLCFPGKIRKVDPLTLEINLTNFAPREELRVVFLNRPAGRDLIQSPGVPPLSVK